MISTPAPPRQSATLPGVLVGTPHGWLYSRDGRSYIFREDHRGGHIYDVDATVDGRRRWWTLDPTIADCRREAARAIAGDDPALAADVARDIWLCSMAIRLRLVDLELGQVPGEMPARENLELPVPRERRLDVTCFDVPVDLAEDLVERVTTAGGRVRFREGVSR